ncbi:MAG: PCRF domain-containing protein [Candidatus Shikimatogenerans bostrichidophilus]|nr:MAG: PCRF domain-containing protein [Candidatus Shikimatogenerans bostrichidophilus]
MIINKDIHITIKNINNIINIKKLKKNLKKIKNKKKFNKYKKIINIYFLIEKIYKDIILIKNLFIEENNNFEINLYKNKIFFLIKKLKKLIFKKKKKKNIILQIKSGTGGKDSNNWVKILIRMYIKWAKNNNFKYKKIDNNNLKIKGKYIYEYLIYENGIHKLIRKSPFNKKKKRQTSLAYVYIYTFNKKKKKIIINNNDLKFNYFRSSGAGGQNINKVETGVRIIHKPTNIVVKCTKTRFQFKNKEYAIKKLKLKLQLLNIEKKEKKNLIYIRNYIMHPYKLIKDLKTGYKTKNLNKILNGNINKIIFNNIKNNI